MGLYLHGGESAGLDSLESFVRTLSLIAVNCFLRCIGVYNTCSCKLVMLIKKSYYSSCVLYTVPQALFQSDTACPGRLDYPITSAPKSILIKKQTNNDRQANVLTHI